MGVIEIDYEEQEIRISCDANKAIAAEWRARYEAARLAEREAYLRSDEGQARTQEVEEARGRGLLP
jgi:hypothetical protein